MKKGFYRPFRPFLRTAIMLMVLITLPFTIIACGNQRNDIENAGATTSSASELKMYQKLRITNQSTFSIQNLVVRFLEDRVEFGDVLPGETTDYRVVPFGVYRLNPFS